MFNTNQVRDLVADIFESNNQKSLVQDFEEKFSERFGVEYSIAINSGTSGLHAALYAAGVGAGDEVIQPSVTVVMDSYATLYLGATPVYVDINPDTWNIDAEQIEKSITDKTKAIIVVSLYGLPVDIDPIMELARKHNLVVIDDSAETVLSDYKGKISGTCADIGVYSFEKTKHLTSGSEGGMVVTNSERFDSIGYNYRMNVITAACGLAQFEIIDELIDRRKKIGSMFLEAIDDCSWLTPQKFPDYCEHSYYTFSVLYNGEKERNLTWKGFYNSYIEMGGDGFYACWKNPYQEPSLKEKFFTSSCPVADDYQKKLMCFKTNYRDLELAQKKVNILSDLINNIGRN
jgi:perosamine synthetase